VLLVIGEALIELEGGASFEQSAFKPRPGGAALLEAVSAAEAGAKVRFLTRVGRDAAGAWIKATLAQSGLEAQVQEDHQHPTSLALTGPDTLFYRAADAQLDAPGEVFFEGGTTLHATAWPFGLDPARTHAVQTFREGIRRGLALSLDLNYHPRAFKGDLLEIIRPFMPFSYLKVDEPAARALGLKPSELFTLAGTVLFFREERVQLLSLMDESEAPLPPNVPAEAIYGRFLAAIDGGAEAAEALSAALEAFQQKKGKGRGKKSQKTEG